MKKITQHALLILTTMTMVACADKNIKSPTPIPPPAPPLVKCDCVIEKPPVQITDAEKPAEPRLPDAAKELAKLTDYSLLKPTQWDEIDGLQTDNLSLAWPAWMQSCSTLVNKPTWQKACNAALQLNSQTTSKPSKNAVQAYFKQYFSVYKTTNVDGSDNGLITGYYQPLLKGSRTQSAQYPYPLYASPNDLITVELDTLFPELKFKRVRGRLVGNKLVPYYNRAEIETEDSPVKGQEFIYIDDIIDVFFLQIQGSGLVQLENGEQVHVGYANQNGHTYNSIGRLLIERGELTLAQASMQGIKNWARNNLDKLRELLNNNPSYVFFRELPAGLPGPLGALGVPVLGGRSVAVDPKFVPLGAPVFLSTTEPNTNKPLKRLMMAQDTGGAIKGGVRADFFWGTGVDAGSKAGAMKQLGKIWVLLPKEFVLK
ncbi:MAG: murein transglycosylase A [Methylotenera sp.]|nr:murein transglycosylase A [Methylotenera sp.]MDP1959653.1 murein transglycosylase A [Methylotenera sp.]MDP3207324.1 murein transglycosylase A [Methylotenera sp.]MDP3302971.1 murein transglycosylase A [Methylotenera sp.]MDP3943249.1 murein transglycosylase A [Methylotenera sp.]